MSKDDESRAVLAAIETTRRVKVAGIPRVLGRSKNVSVLLDGAGIVARVTSAKRVASLAKEIAVAQHIAAKNGPGVRTAVDPGPHMYEDHAVSFWHYAAPIDCGIDEPGDAPVPLSAAAAALSQLHAALADFPGMLPSYRDQIAKCRLALVPGGALPCLVAAEVQLLAAAHDRLVDRLPSCRGDIVLHGDAHLGNVCFTATGPLWLDFEDVCRGPREWDIARFGESDCFAGVDTPVLDLLEIFRSFCVAVWCGADPSKREDALHHFHVVKRVASL